MRPIILSFVLLLLFARNTSAQSDVLMCKNGIVEFLSEAPLETIRAKSSLVQGVISTSSNEFVFEVAILSFQGFNSQLQREHFFENYMETERFPKAIFSGKLIEQVNWGSDQSQKVRAKGNMEIHGLSRQRIINVEIIPNETGFLMRAEFEIQVKDHDIYIPRMVEQKISPVIQVKVNIQIESE